MASRTLTARVLAAAIAVAVGALAGAAAVAAPILSVVVAGSVALVAVVLGSRREERRSPQREATSASGLTVVTTWWMHPAWLLPLVAIPTLLWAWDVSPLAYLERWATPKFLTEEHVTLGLLSVAAFILGAAIAARGRTRSPTTALELSAAQRNLLLTAGKWLFALTLLGHVVWGLVAVARGLTGATVTNIVEGGDIASSIKEGPLAPVAGITTLTQFAPLAATCLFLLGRMRALNPYPYLGILLVLGAARLVLRSERLALIEIAVPLVVLWLAMPTGGRRAIVISRLRQTLPVWIPVVVVLLFGATEYVRSWNAHYRDLAEQSYPAFVENRLGAYYTTGHNNAALIDQYGSDSAVPYYPLAWFWNFPVVSTVVSYERVSGTAEEGRGLSTLLEQRANPEFNNPGGLLMPIYEFGAAGALVFWLCAGLLLGLVYRRFREASPGAVVFYPILVVGALEIPRFLYWTQGRAFPAIAAGLLLMSLLNARRPAREEPAAVERSRLVTA